MASIRKRINQETIKFQARIRVSNHPTMTRTFKLRSQAVQWAKKNRNTNRERNFRARPKRIR